MKLNELKFDKLKTDKKEIYTNLWKKSNLNFDIQKTGQNDFSYQFEIGFDPVENVASKIADIFNLSDKVVFIEKFKMVCAGNGNELAKITTLHSSSLCSLLFFYNVTKENPLIIDEYTFTQSIFEFKNKVIGYPSNIDVVLIGKDSKGKKVILFLESKFSEYITGRTKSYCAYKLGKSYLNNKFSKPIYSDDSLLSDLGLELNQNEEELSLIPKEDKYVEGLKQIISHYVGIRNLLTNNCYEKDNANFTSVKEEAQNAEILLGEILFDNFGNEFEPILNSYEKDYEILAKKLNEISEKPSEFKILNKLWHYSTLKDFPKDEKIREFYFGNNNN